MPAKFAKNGTKQHKRSYSQIIRAAMAAQGITQLELAHLTGLSTSIIQKLLSEGKRNPYNPCATTVTAVVQALEFTPEETVDLLSSFGNR